MTLVWLVKNAAIYEQLVADFDVAVATAHDYVNDAIDRLVSLATPFAFLEPCDAKWKAD